MQYLLYILKLISLKKSYNISGSLEMSFTLILVIKDKYIIEVYFFTIQRTKIRIPTP